MVSGAYATGSNPNRRIWGIGLAAIGFLFLMIFGGKVFENLDADQIMVIQSPVSGELTWHNTAGVKWQGFGKITKYPKRSMYEFQTTVRFNDGGHAKMCGSIQYEMPLDDKNLTRLHVRFGSRGAVQRQLIETITNKSIYMTGPLMSSKESYAEKRNDLIRDVEDQVANGVYKTTQKEMKVKDPMTGADKTVTVVEKVLEGGIPARQEEAILASFGIRPFNFSIDSLPYDSTIELQIKQQQQITMDVQTSIADAKKAEQRVITVAKQGEADAAKAKWEQEVIKAKEVTAAEQRLRVAQLDAQSAEQTKRKEILLGEGEGARKALVMRADGALEKKLEAWVKVNEFYANAIKDYRGAWVPAYVSGGGEGKATAGSGAYQMMEILTLKALKDLGLDMNVKGKTQTDQ